MSDAPEPQPEPTPGQRAGSRGRQVLIAEVAVVTGLAVGLSALRSVLSFAAAVAAPAQVSAQRTTLNRPVTPDQPWIDLGFQLVRTLGLVLPVALVMVLVLIRGERVRAIGLARQRLGRGVLLGLGTAAVVGGLGLATYLVSFALGQSLTVVPTSLPDVWWRVPLLVLSACANAALEEVVLTGYLVHRIQQLGGRPAVAVAVSAGIRGAYHLYQGLAGLLGNLVMGAVFAGWFVKRRTVVPQLVAHAAIDIGAFLGYLALVGRVDWLPS
ncbi:MAG: CPBP family intramembrane glutamic endopeptidase [Angustibacter sp.]